MRNKRDRAFDDLIDRRGADECWPWLGTVDRDGYGKRNTGLGGIKRPHRMVWEREHGPIPDGMVVCHRCDVKVCCNLAHLFIGTNADNQRDKREKGRARWRMSATNRIKRYILAPADVVSIRQRHAAGCVSVVALAAEYSVAVVTIRAILKGRLWPKVAAA